jgi:hypothetical protein
MALRDQTLHNNHSSNRDWTDSETSTYVNNIHRKYALVGRIEIS